MATHRFIDPKIRRSESVSQLTFRQRDMWYGLILTVDDQGRCQANPALIRSVVWPLEDISLEDVKLDLQELEAHGFILGYEVEGKKYLQIQNWQVYQRDAEWLGYSKYPAPDGWCDRFRYHGKGRQIIQSDNWNSNRLPNELKVFSSPLPNELKAFSSPLPNHDVNGDVKGNGNEDGDGDGDVKGDGDCDALPVPVNNAKAQRSSASPVAKISRPNQLKIWNEAIGQLQAEMSKADFDTWIRPLKMVGVEGSVFKLVAVSSYGRDTALARAGPMLTRILSGLAGFEVELSVVSAMELEEIPA